MGYGDSNTFRGLRVVNLRRCAQSFHQLNAWSPGDWMTAVAGEVGEAANLIKKLKRIDTDGIDTPQNREMLALFPCYHPNGEAKGIREVESEVKAELVRRTALELADAVIYIDLLAARLGIDLGQAVIEKFNMTSKKIGSMETLPY